MHHVYIFMNALLPLLDKHCKEFLNGGLWDDCSQLSSWHLPVRYAAIC